MPRDDNGLRTIPVELQDLKMYQNYQSLLEDLSTAMGWQGHGLSVGEDVAYANMVACPSAKWINRVDPRDRSDPPMPLMTHDEQRGIVGECFHDRKYFLRQLFQSLPAVLMVFSQSTTDAFLAEMQGRFTAGNPQPGDLIADLVRQEIRLKYGLRDDGTPLEARVIFSPHITGDPAHFAAARQRVLDQLIAEARAGRLQLNSATGHLRRPAGSCVFCTMLQIGPCDYQAELRPLSSLPVLAAAVVSAPQLAAEKAEQNRLLSEFLAAAPAPPAGAPAAVEGGLLAAEPREPTGADGWRLAGDPERQAAAESQEVER